MRARSGALHGVPVPLQCFLQSQDHPARDTEEEGEDDTSGACSARPSSRCRADVVASLPGANLHSPGGQSGGAAFRTFPEHLELLSREVPTHVTCQFFPRLSACLFFISSKILDSGGEPLFLRYYIIFSQSAACLFMFLNFLLMNRSA